MLSHVSTPELILSAFIVLLVLWVLLAEFLPGKRGGDPPDGDEDERDPGPALEPLAA